MNCLAFPNIVSATGTITSLSASTDGNIGIVLTPDPIIETGTIGLVVDLKASGTNFALGTNNWITTPITNGNNNVAVGNNNMSNLEGNENIAIGYSNLRVITDGFISNNIAIGTRAMEYVDNNCANNIAIGRDVLNNNITYATNNIVIGNDAANEMPDTNNNKIIGYNVARHILGGAGDNTIIASNTLNLLDTTLDSTLLIGNNCMNATLISNGDIVLGQSNLQQMGNSSNNIIIGASNLQNATVPGATNNICIGSQLNQNVDASIGNILIGRNIDFTSNDKRDCIVIGHDIQLPAETGDDTTIIGGTKVGLNGIVKPVYNHENYNTLAVRPQSALYNYPFVIDTFSGLVQFTGDTSTQTVYYRDLNNLRNGNSTQVLNIRLSFTCVYTTTADVSTYFFTMSHILPMVYTGGQWLFLNPLVPSTTPYNQNTANNGYTVASSNTTGNIVGGITGGYYTINSGELIYFATQTGNIYYAPCNYSVVMTVNGVGF